MRVVLRAVGLGAVAAGDGVADGRFHGVLRALDARQDHDFDGEFGIDTYGHLGHGVKLAAGIPGRNNPGRGRAARTYPPGMSATDSSPGSRPLVALLSGAGISTDSGIPD